MHRDAPISVGHVDARFWQDLVPQLAHTYEFVWDTLVCLGSLHEHVDYMSIKPNFDSAIVAKVTNQEHQRALRVYNRAITNVRRLADRGEIDESVVILSYMLFASVEFQQRNVKAGNDLMKRCCKILAGNLTSLSTKQYSITGQAVHEVITPFVLTKAVVTATMRNTLPSHWAVNDEVGTSISEAVPSTVRAFNEARDQLNSLMDASFEVLRHAEFFPNVKDNHPSKVSFLSQRQSILYQLIQWEASLTATSNLIPDVETDWIRSYMLMYWTVCYISLATCISLRQTSFDEYMDHFAGIIEHATVYLRRSARSTNVKLLSSSDPGVVPPLYFCATKCRDPVLRREALRLIRHAPLQEDLCAFVAPARVVATVISVEEGGFQLPFKRNLYFLESHYPTCLPPEERRFAYFSVVGRQAPGGKLRQALELTRFEFADDGSKRLVNDYVWLHDEDDGLG